MKTCKTCNETKELSEFYKGSAYADGHINNCKECHGAYMAAYKRSPEGAASKRESNYRYRNKYPVKARAAYLMHDAIKEGKLIKPDHCEACLIHCIPQGHHSDYTKPLDVHWLCQTCHTKEHN